jgi:hypothetical protein
MDQLLHIALAFPTVLLTILVGIAMVYWIFVILGALDIDLVADADADGLDAGGDVGGDVAGDAGGGAGDGGDAGDAGHDHGDHGDHGGSAGILAALGLRKVPLTISTSLIVLFAWTICLIAMLALDGFDGLPRWILGIAVLLGSLLMALPLAAVCARPIAPLFVIHEAKKRKDYVGSVCTITTGEVTGKFGQARIQEGAYVLDVPVRCDTDHGFARHDKALIIDYDKARDAYLVEPMATILSSKEQSH